MRDQRIIIISPLAWLLVTFWKPILVALSVLSVLLVLMVLVGGPMAIQSARQHDATLPTMYIPETWRASLTQAALTPTLTPP